MNRRDTNDNPLSPAEAYQSALRTLAQRECSAAELQQKLVQRGASSETASTVIEQLQQQGWVDDHRYAQLLARSVARRGYGPRRLQMELRRRGITAELAAEALADEPIDWFEVADKIWQRRAERLDPNDYQGRTKLTRTLLGRGFEYDQVKEAISAWLAQTE